MVSLWSFGHVWVTTIGWNSSCMHWPKKILLDFLQHVVSLSLKFHTDPNWVKELLQGIDKGVSLGYHGLRCQRISRNLASASQHPQIIDEELGKEVRARRIVGPFDTPPIANLQCSGVGVIPKKKNGAGEWSCTCQLLLIAVLTMA